MDLQRWRPGRPTETISQDNPITGLSIPKPSVPRQSDPGKGEPGRSHNATSGWASEVTQYHSLCFILLVKEITEIHPGLRRENKDHSSQGRYADILSRVYRMIHTLRHVCIVVSGKYYLLQEVLEETRYCVDGILNLKWIIFPNTWENKLVRTGVPAVAQWEQQYLWSTRTQVQWHSARDRTQNLWFLVGFISIALQWELLKSISK